MHEQTWGTKAIADCLTHAFAGEWGGEPTPANAIVLRATDIDNDGHVMGQGAQRAIGASKLKAKQLQDGDILLEGSGGSPDSPVGRVALFEVRSQAQPALCSNFFKTLRPNREIVDARFLWRKLCWFYRQPQLLSMQQQTTGIINLKFQDYLAAQISLPLARSEQSKVADVLDTLDTTIRQTEAIIVKLKQVKKGLLHDLLTRGIDTNGELRPPQSEAPHLYKASPLGWIPVEWNVVATSHRCSLITKGTTPASTHMWQGEEGVRFLRVDNLTFDGQLNFNASSFRISKETHEGELMRSQCLSGDVLTNIVGPPLGKLGLIKEESGQININQAIALFRPTSELLSCFLLTWLGSALAQVWLRQRAKQTSGQVNLTLALCQELPIPDMTLIEQRAIVERVAAPQARIDVEASTLHKLEQLKSGLMDDLLTGRVRVTPLLAQAPTTQP